MWRVIERTPQCREQQLVLGYPENAELAPRRACRSHGWVRHFRGNWVHRDVYLWSGSLWQLEAKIHILEEVYKNTTAIEYLGTPKLPM